MKSEIEKEIKEGIRPSAPVVSATEIVLLSGTLNRLIVSILLINLLQAEEINKDLTDNLYYVEAIVEHRTTPVLSKSFF